MTKKRILFLGSSQSLKTLSEACFCLTPKVFLPLDNTLYLDIGQTEKLLGGEQKILSTFENLTHTFESPGSTVLVDRPEWAQMFATQEKNILDSGKSLNALMRLPIDRLPFCGDPISIEEELSERKKLVSFMKRVGMYGVKDFFQLNTQSINRRFGKMGIDLSDWLTGKRSLTLPLVNPFEPIQESIDGEEIFEMDSLLFCLRKTLIKMETRLQGRALIAKELKFQFHLASHMPLLKTLPLSEPLREASPLLKVIQEFLRNLQWQSPLQRLEVTVSDTIPYAPGQLSLWDQTENQKQDLLNFVDRWRSRYGDNHVGFAQLQPSYLPEKSFSLATEVAESTPDYIHPARPLFIFSPPQPYFPPKNARLIPSEKLVTEWWEGPTVREYFTVTTDSDHRPLWVFWDENKQQWFLHGSF